MASLFPPSIRKPSAAGRGGGSCPFTAVLPNLVTLLGLCAGLTAIRMAVEHRFDIAVAAIIFAIILDGIDGRLARYFRATSRFGEQLELARGLRQFRRRAGALHLRLAARRAFLVRLDLRARLRDLHGLRLARFNAALLAEEPQPDWNRDFFVGVPAPAGAGLVFLPFFLQRIVDIHIAGVVVAIYTILIALLMVSRIPTLSGKRFGRRIPRERVLPVLVIGVFLVALLASYPFSFLAVAALAYLAHIPLAWRARNQAEERAAQHAPVEDRSAAAGVKPAKRLPTANILAKDGARLPFRHISCARQKPLRAGALGAQNDHRETSIVGDPARRDHARRRQRRRPKNSASSW